MHLITKQRLRKKVILTLWSKFIKWKSPGLPRDFTKLASTKNFHKNLRAEKCCRLLHNSVVLLFNSVDLCYVVVTFILGWGQQLDYVSYKRPLKYRKYNASQRTVIGWDCWFWKPQNKELYNFAHRVKNLIRRISEVKPFSVSEDQMDVTKVQPARVSNTNGCAHGKVASYFSTWSVPITNTKI